MGFRKTAADIYRVDRRDGIGVQGAEKNRFCPGGGERFEVFRVVELKRRIPYDANLGGTRFDRCRLFPIRSRRNRAIEPDG